MSNIQGIRKPEHTYNGKMSAREADIFSRRKAVQLSEYRMEGFERFTAESHRDGKTARLKSILWVREPREVRRVSE